MHLVEFRQKLNALLIEKGVVIPAYRVSRRGALRDYNAADLIRMWGQGLDAPEIAAQLSRTEDANFPVKAETIQANLVDLRSVIRNVLASNPNGMEELVATLGVSEADIKYMLVKRPRDTHPGDNLTKEARRLIQTGEATSQRDLVAKLKAYAQATPSLKSTKQSAIEKAANNARREANLTAGKGQKWKHGVEPKIELPPGDPLGPHPITVPPKPDTSNPDQPTSTRGGLRYWYQKNKYGHSPAVPIPFRDLIMLHNDANDYDEFLLDVQEAVGREINQNELKRWCNLVRMMYSRFFSGGGTLEELAKKVRLTPDEVAKFMTQPKVEPRVPVVRGIHKK